MPRHKITTIQIAATVSTGNGECFFIQNYSGKLFTVAMEGDKTAGQFILDDIELGVSHHERQIEKSKPHAKKTKKQKLNSATGSPGCRSGMCRRSVNVKGSPGLQFSKMKYSSAMFA